MFSTLIKDNKLMERIQSGATKLIPDLKELPYEPRLMKRQLPSHYYRRARGNLIEVYIYMMLISTAYSPEINIHIPEDRAGLIYCGALCETDCVGLNLGRNKCNKYSRDKRGAFGSAGPIAAAYVALA